MDQGSLRLLVAFIQECPPLLLVVTRLLNKRIAKRVMALNEELVPLAQLFQQFDAWHASRFTPPVAATACQNEIPHSIKITPTPSGLETVGKEMVDIWGVYFAEGETAEAVEAVALLIAAQGITCTGDGLAPIGTIHEELFCGGVVADR